MCFAKFVKLFRVEIDSKTHKAATGACIWMLIGSFLPIIVDSLFRVMLLEMSCRSLPYWML